MKYAVLVSALLALASPASAQPTPEQQRQAYSLLYSVGEFAWVDGARLHGVGLYIEGWAFDYASGTQGRLDVLIDGKPVSNAVVVRGPRQDVYDAFIAFHFDRARVPWYSGASTLIDVVNHYAPGAHVVQFRIWNPAGIPKDSNARAFVIPE